MFRELESDLLQITNWQINLNSVVSGSKAPIGTNMLSYSLLQQILFFLI